MRIESLDKMRQACVLFVFLLCCLCGLGRSDGDSHFTKALETLEAQISARTSGMLLPEGELEQWLGTHYVIEISNISDLELLKDGNAMEKLLVDAATYGQLAILSYSHRVFDKGVSAYLLLQESHMALHTFSEFGYAALDIFTCGAESKLKGTAAFIQDALQGDSFLNARLPRGIPQKRIIHDPKEFVIASLATADIIVTENDLKAPSMKESDLSMDDYESFDEVKSEHQTITFLRHPETKDICMVLDGVVQSCQSVDTKFAELFVHLPIGFLSDFSSALVIGGGCGLLVEELVKYPTLKRVVQLELDEQVPIQCEKHLGHNPHLPNSPNRDERVEWIFGDAKETIDQLNPDGDRSKMFDLVLFDIIETGELTATGLFQDIKSVMKPGGILIKNENYMMESSQHFDEYLEVSVDGLPVIPAQRFVLQSNFVSLFMPSFSLLDEHKIKTSFIAHEIPGRFRQFKEMIVGYSKTGMDYESRAGEVFEKIHNRPAHISKQEFQYQAALEKAMKESKIIERCAPDDEACLRKVANKICGTETATQGYIVQEPQWVDRCQIPPKSDELQISIRNEWDRPIEIRWVSPNEDEETMLVVPKIGPGDVKAINTFFGHVFVIFEAGDGPYGSGKYLTISHQHFTHPKIGFSGISTSFRAAALWKPPPPQQSSPQVGANTVKRDDVPFSE